MVRFCAIVLLMAVGLAAAELRQGDWIVTGAEVVENREIALSGDLILQAKADLTLRNVKLTMMEKPGSSFKIEARAGSKLTVEDTAVAPAKKGVSYGFLIAGATLVLRRAAIEGALQISDTEGALIENSTFLHDADAITLTNARNTTVRNNVATYTGAVAGGAAVTASNCRHSTISGNRFLKGSNAIGLRESSDSRVTGNEIVLAAGGTGIAVWNPSAGNNWIADNRVSAADGFNTLCTAFRIVNSPRPNYIVNNTVTGMFDVALVTYSANVVLAGNRATRLTSYERGAFHLYRSHHVKLLNNEVRESRSGIQVIASESIEVRGNRVEGSAYGLAVFRSRDVLAERNSFVRNADNVLMIDSGDNILQENNLVGGTRQAYENRTNVWRRNYWDDYAGDGSTGHPLLLTGVDAAPRTTPWPDLPAAVPTLVPGAEIPVASPSETISGNVTWSNCERELRGTLIVPAGASLTINNCKLSVASLASGATNAIAVNGTLQLLNSEINGHPLNAVWELQTSRGARLIIRDSKLRYPGGWHNGITLIGDQAVIENNEITGAYAAVRADNSSGHRIVNNRISECVNGLMIQGGFQQDSFSREHVIENNSISGCNATGIILWDVAGSRVAGNRLDNVAIGIALGGYRQRGTGAGMEVVVRGNEIRNTMVPVSVSSRDATVTGNNIFSDGVFRSLLVWPAELPPPSYPSLGAPARDFASGNRWDADGKGNFWNTYPGEDSNGDGIGDTPYAVAPMGMDRFPLLVPPAGGTCSFWLGWAWQSVAASGATLTVPVKTQPGCRWSAAADAGWLVPSSAVSGTGSGSVSFRLSDNAGTSARSAAVTIGGQAVRVTQNGSACRYALEPAAATVTFAAEANPGAADRSAELRIADRVFKVTQSAGSLGSVRLAAQGVVNAASGIAAGGVVPGSLVSLFGSGLGPRQGVAGFERGLGGARLFFDSTEAFLSYSSAAQLNAVVPCGLVPGTLTRLRVETEAGAGLPVDLPVLAADPAVFAYSYDWTAPIAAIAVNQDGKLNSQQEPAARGSVVTLWATGYGLTEPRCSDGVQPETPVFPRPVVPFSVTVDRVPVPPEDVLFAGAVYSGVLQVNFRVPARAGAGQLELRLIFDADRTAIKSPPVVISVK